MENNNVIKAFLKKGLTVVIIVFFVSVVLCGTIYQMYQELVKSAKKANDEYKQSVTVDTNSGGIMMPYDTENDGEEDNDEGKNPVDEENESPDKEDEKPDSELLQLFRDKGYNIDEYFDDVDVKTKEEQLKRILNAEIITQFPYIKEWEDNGKLSGVIRFKRISAGDDNNYTEDDGVENNNEDTMDPLKGCLEYASYNDFMQWINNYNLDINSETAEENKNNAMNHFTLKFEDTNKNGVIDINEYKVGYAVIKEAKVTSNDDAVNDAAKTDISIIKNKISGRETFKDATTYSIIEENDGEEKKVTYNFKVLNIEWIDANAEGAIKDIIEKYTMPVDMLINLLTYSEDLDFVLDVANLAYNSTIVVGIYDSNEDNITYSNEYIYKKQTQCRIGSYISVSLALSEKERISEGETKEPTWQQCLINILNKYSEDALEAKDALGNPIWPAINKPDDKQYEDLYTLNKSFEYYPQDNKIFRLSYVRNRSFIKE